MGSGVLGLRHLVPFDILGRTSFVYYFHHALSLLIVLILKLDKLLGQVLTLLLVLLMLLHELLLDQRVLKESLEVLVQ